MSTFITLGGMWGCSNMGMVQKNPNSSCNSKFLDTFSTPLGAQQRNILGGSPSTNLNDLRTASTVYVQVTLSTFCDKNIRCAAACGGVLVSPTTVVTASHCLTPPADLGDVESVDIFFSPTLANGVPSIRATSFTTHPKYPEAYEINGIPQTATDSKGRLKQMTTPNYDIAIVQFSSPLPPSYKPIPVWTRPQSLSPNTPVWLSGWGQTSDNGPASRTLLGVASVFSRMANPAAKDPPSEGILVIGPKANSGACHGDSGGPLNILGADGAGNEFWFVAGVTQGFNSLYFPHLTPDGTDCELGASLYTALGHYKDWIEGTAGIRMVTQDDLGVSRIVKSVPPPPAGPPTCVMPVPHFLTP